MRADHDGPHCQSSPAKSSQMFIHLKPFWNWLYMKCNIFTFEMALTGFVWGQRNQSQKSHFLRVTLNFSSSMVLTSPSLCLLAEWATWAPLSQPPPRGCDLPCLGTGCAGPNGSWWKPANKDTCLRRGAPPAGHGSTFPLLPERGKRGDKHGKMMHQIITLMVAAYVAEFHACYIKLM